MELEHAFTVPVGVDRAWEVLRDIERIAPCMPGATVDAVEGEDFSGRVKVKVGPMQITYTGDASFVEADDAAHRVVIEARGRETRGSGTATATIRAALQEDGDASTRVQVVTDLAVTGRPAQFGRGVMADVGQKLIGQFADCLAGQLAAEPVPAATGEGRAGATVAGAAVTGADRDEHGGGDVAAEAPSQTSGEALPTDAGVPTRGGPAADVLGGPPSPRAESAIDLVELGGAPLVRRLAPIVGLAAVAWLLVRWRRRR